MHRIYLIAKGAETPFNYTKNVKGEQYLLTLNYALKPLSAHVFSGIIEVWHKFVVFIGAPRARTKN